MASEQVLETFCFHFGVIFGAIWEPESKKGEKVKIELSCKRELNFEGPGHLKNRPKNNFLGKPLRGGSLDLSWQRFWCFRHRFWAPLGSLFGSQNASGKHVKIDTNFRIGGTALALTIVELGRPGSDSRARVL